MFEQKDLSFIYRYFIAEKQESLLFLIIGIIAILLAVVCWFFIKSNPSFFKGAAMPLLAIGLIQIVVGYSVYTRTDKQKAGIAYNIGIEPVSFVKQKELPRMKTVMKNFVIYRWVEIVFILTGLLLIFLFKSNPDKTFWYGFGVALAMQAVIMLGADYFAEQRGKIYNEELQKMIS
jgi:4-amino-4-deoxy-L-arabinose transferase-like glycosyltransferase